MAALLALPLLLPPHPLPATPQTPRHATPRLAATPRPFYALIWRSDAPFLYESLSSAVVEAPRGASAARCASLHDAHALGARLRAAAPRLAYSVYRVDDGRMLLVGSRPRRVNVPSAAIRFRRRRTPTGGAEDARLGVGGMGDDVWRELLEGSRSDVDDAWAEFRRQLELGRELEVVDEAGDPLELGDFLPEPEEEDYD